MTTAASAARAPGIDDVDLALCERLLAAHLADVERAFGAEGLGVIDLPPLHSGALVGSQIRVVATLYWAREIEHAGVLPFVEALADAVVTGTWLAPLGAAIHPLVALRRRREQRFTRPERQALFDRLFHAEGADFDQMIRALASVLSALGRQPADQGIGHLEARAAEAAAVLGAAASTGGAGVAAFAARDIVEQIRGALGVLQHPDLVRALGGGGPWQIVSRHAPAVLGRMPNVSQSLSRARAGLSLIEWVAREAEGLEHGRARLARNAPVIAAAEAWLASTGGP